MRLANVLDHVLASSNLQEFTEVSTLVNIVGGFVETLPGMVEMLISPSSLPFIVVQAIWREIDILVNRT